MKNLPANNFFLLIILILLPFLAHTIGYEKNHNQMQQRYPTSIINVDDNSFEQILVSYSAYILVKSKAGIFAKNNMVACGGVVLNQTTIITLASCLFNVKEEYDGSVKISAFKIKDLGVILPSSFNAIKLIPGYQHHIEKCRKDVICNMHQLLRTIFTSGSSANNIFSFDDNNSRQTEIDYIHITPKFINGNRINLAIINLRYPIVSSIYPLHHITIPQSAELLNFFPVENRRIALGFGRDYNLPENDILNFGILKYIEFSPYTSYDLNQKYTIRVNGYTTEANDYGSGLLEIHPIESSEIKLWGLVTKLSTPSPAEDYPLIGFISLAEYSWWINGILNNGNNLAGITCFLRLGVESCKVN